MEGGAVGGGDGEIGVVGVVEETRREELGGFGGAGGLEGRDWANVEILYLRRSVEAASFGEVEARRG